MTGGLDPGLYTRLTQETASLIGILSMAQVNTAAVTLETRIVPAQTIGQGYLLQEQ